MQDAIDFLTLLPQKARVKVVYNIGKSMFVLDNSLFKKLGNTDIWEFRTLYDGMAYRLFAFWDTDAETLVVATHGITKKTQKTPQQEIERAKRIMNDYYKTRGGL